MRGLIVACVLTAAAGAQPTPTPEAPQQIQILVKQALEDRLAANNIPDLNLARSQARIAIRQDMPRSDMSLTSEALPHVEGYEFYLSSAANLQADADRTARDIFFITVDQPSIENDTATISIGTDIVFPQAPTRFKLCCCVGTGQFHKDGVWTFVKWARLICS